mgnify:CR=1 FL=1
MRTLLTLLLLIQLNFGFGQDKFDVSAVAKFQKELNTEYADAKTSPLTAEDFAVLEPFLPCILAFFLSFRA